MSVKNIRRSVAAAALFGVASLAHPASAQSIAAAPPMAGPGYGWTGFYLRGGAGYGSWNADTTTQDPATGRCILCVPQTQGGGGGLGTFGGGFDYRITNHFVAGLFADVDRMGFEGTIQDQDPFFAGTISQDWALNGGARAGWLITPTILPYLDAGYSETHFTGANMHSTFADMVTGFHTPGFWRGGWFIGAGVEAALAPGWSVKGEYRYADYGTVRLSDTNGTNPLANITFHPVTQTFRTELVYRFNAFASPADQASSPPPAPRTNWTGFYVKGGGGYGMWNADTTTINPTTGFCILCQRQTQGGGGALATAGGGFDYQFNNRVVAGVFADADRADMRGTIQDQGPFFAGKITQDWSWAGGARAGWLAMPAFLPFIDAGYAQAHFTSASMQETFNGASTGFRTPAFWAGGWFIGGGAEAAISPCLSVRGEYRYADYGASRLRDTNPAFAFPASTLTFHPTTQTFRLEAVVKFNPFGG